MSSLALMLGLAAALAQDDSQILSDGLTYVSRSRNVTFAVLKDWRIHIKEEVYSKLWEGICCDGWDSTNRGNTLFFYLLSERKELTTGKYIDDFESRLRQRPGTIKLERTLTKKVDHATSEWTRCEYDWVLSKHGGGELAMSMVNIFTTQGKTNLVLCLFCDHELFASHKPSIEKVAETFKSLDELGEVVVDENRAIYDRQTYALKGDFTLNGTMLRGYASAKDKGAVPFLFASFEKETPIQLYLVNSSPVGSDVRLIVELQPGIRVAAARMPAREATYEAARKMIEAAHGAIGDWEAHKAFFLDLRSGTAESIHKGWIAIAADLERAHTKHPAHLGILRDLIVAYTRLHTLEKGTDRGANLCLLIPQRIAEYEQAVGVLSAGEAETFHLALAMLYFQTGLSPVAVLEADKAGPSAVLIRTALEAIGQSDFTVQETFEVESYVVTVYRSNGAAPSEKMMFDRLFFVTRPKDRSTAPGRVWYTLSRQTLQKEPHYFLYGRHEEARNLLCLYGRQEPTYEEVKAKVKELMISALKK